MNYDPKKELVRSKKYIEFNNLVNLKNPDGSFDLSKDKLAIQAYKTDVINERFLMRGQTRLDHFK